jgi:molybdenum cofactor biosynthesis enzyme MoaA
MNVNLELTDHCNLACRMCSQSLRDEAHGVPMRFLDFATWDAALRGLEGLPDVALCPHWLGEPTLHPEFERFVAHAFALNTGNRLFRRFKLHTNAVILPEARARGLLACAQAPDVAPDTFQAVHFSIDAHSREAYATVKGADKRDLVYRNVTRFLDLRDDVGSALPRAHIAFVVQPGNAQEAVAFVEHWAAELASRGRPFRLTSEWPPFDMDAIYLRRLNAGDQARADALHAEACARSGIAVAERAAGSF